MWKEILAIAFVLSAALIFFGLNKLRVNGRHFFSLNNRIMISLLFPLVLVLLFTLGIVILAVALGTLLVFGLIGLILFLKHKRKKKQEIALFIE